jgi:hypothetical protein
MNNPTISFRADKGVLVLGAVLMVTMTGCVGYVEQPRPAGAYMPPPPVDVVVAVQDDYVYYPGYDVYYNSYRREYAYPEGGRWVSRPTPRGVSVEALRGSPSVRMDFHDSPANHHAEVVQKYPKNWSPSGAKQGRKGNERDDQRGDRQGK